MERISAGMVDHQFAVFVGTAKEAGALDRDANIVLDHGNSSYGYQFRMRDADSGMSVLSGLGTTKREAFYALKHAVEALELVSRRVDIT
jgi:hypothetical protein